MKARPTRKKIIALLFRRVGDSLLATPALRSIKKHFPDARLGVIVESQVKRIFELNPWIDEIIETAPSPSAFRLAKDIRRSGKAEMTLDFLADPRSASGCFLSRATTRVGFAYPLRSALYHRAVPLQQQHAPIYSAGHKAQIAEAAGAPVDSLQTDFYLSINNQEQTREILASLHADEASMVVSIFPFSRRDYKRWNPSNFAEVIRRLHMTSGLIPVVISGPGEADYCRGIAAAAGLSEEQLRVFDDLGNMAAFLRHSSLYLGNDGGPKHLAVAMNTPTVTLFRNDPPEYWTPPNDPNHIAIVSHTGDSSASDVAAVIQAADQILKRLRHE